MSLTGKPFGHAPRLPSAMFTKVRISSTVTMPLPSQSPTQGPAIGVAVGVGDGVDVTGVEIGEGVVLGCG